MLDEETKCSEHCDSEGSAGEKTEVKTCVVGCVLSQPSTLSLILSTLIPKSHSFSHTPLKKIDILEMTAFQC